MKKPRPDGGVVADRDWREVYRARRSEAPGTGAFFDNAAMRGLIVGKSCAAEPNLSTRGAGTAVCKISKDQKKAGLERARLKVWPREADTITFQEGLLSARTT